MISSGRMWEMANWKCECGRGPSIDHPVGGYCSARAAIERAYTEGFNEGIEAAAKIADEATIWDGGVVRQQILALRRTKGK